MRINWTLSFSLWKSRNMKRLRGYLEILLYFLLWKRLVHGRCLRRHYILLLCFFIEIYCCWYVLFFLRFVLVNYPRRQMSFPANFPIQLLHKLFIIPDTNPRLLNNRINRFISLLFFFLNIITIIK